MRNMRYIAALHKVISCLALVLAVCAPALAQSSGAVAIVGAQLIDGNGGPPLHNSVVIIQGKKITAVGQEGQIAVPAGAKVIDAHGMTVMPGMIDMHVHLMILGAGDYNKWFPWLEKEHKAAEVMRISAKQLLMAGVTTVRDVCGPTKESVELRDAINEGKEVGSRLFVTGAFVARSCWMLSDYYCTKVDSPEQAASVSKERIAAGVDWVKAWAGLQPADTKAIADVVHAAGKKVVAHGTSVSEILGDIAAPVDSMEHVGNGATGTLSPELISKIAESHIWIVPTIMQGWVYKLTEDFPERIDNQQVKKDLPPDIYKMAHESDMNFQRLQYYFPDVQARIRVIPDSMRTMMSSGLAGRMLIGTDSGTPLNWNVNSTAAEMLLFAKFGMPPLAVISAGTRLPAQALGKGDEFGTVDPGKFADVIVVDGNPLDDMGVLQNVVHVFKEGVQYK
jgi:imidazolonepropionase-like amidohydrolase